MSDFNFDSPPALHVRLYGRHGCEKCNEAGRLLETMHEDFDFYIEKVDIDSDLAIREKLNDHIPVVTFNGANRVQMPVTPDKLRRAFRRALQIEEKDAQAAAEAAAELNAQTHPMTV